MSNTTRCKGAGYFHADYAALEKENERLKEGLAHASAGISLAQTLLKRMHVQGYPIHKTAIKGCPVCEAFAVMEEFQEEIKQALAEPEAAGGEEG